MPDDENPIQPALRLIDLGRVEEARRAIDEAGDAIPPEERDAVHALSYLYSDQLDKAQKLVPVNPETSLGMLARISLAIKEDDPEDIKRVLIDARRFPDMVDRVLIEIAYSHLRWGQPNLVLEIFEGRPDTVSSIPVRVDALRLLKRPAEALALAERGLEEYPESPVLRCALAMAKYGNRQFEEAWRLIAPLLESETELGTLRCGALIAIEAGEFAAASQLCERLVTERPWQSGSWYVRAVLRGRIHDDLGVVADLEHSVSIVPAPRDAYITLANRLLRRGHLRRAFRIAMQLVRQEDQSEKRITKQELADLAPVSAVDSSDGPRASST